MKYFNGEIALPDLIFEVLIFPLEEADVLAKAANLVAQSSDHPEGRGTVFHGIIERTGQRS